MFFAGRMLQGLVSSQWVNCLNVVSHLEVFLTMLALTMQALSLLTGPYSTSNSSEDLYWCICLHGCQGCSSEGGSDLTSEAFISALKRFISRRGMRSQILSDNGTNFVGANNYLKEVYKFLAAKATQDQVMKFTTSQQIKWSFIPEHLPHFGGICEAAVKSAKFHLKHILGDHKLTFEEFSTALCQVEA